MIEVTRGRKNTGSHDFILTHQWRERCMCLCASERARARSYVWVCVLNRTHPEPPGLRITFGSSWEHYDRGQRDAGLGSNVLLSAEQMSVCKCARIHRSASQHVQEVMWRIWGHRVELRQVGQRPHEMVKNLILFNMLDRLSGIYVYEGTFHLG